MASKGLNQNALNAIMANSEVKENKVAPMVVEESNNRKVFQSFTLNLEISEYQRLREYVKLNEVKSTNALIRSLLVEKGII